jgi:AraC family transcriptional regulator
MTVTAQLLASGPGWRVDDLICRAGAHDRPFEEQHGDYCIAAVTDGTFRYSATQGTAVLAPGSMLLGNAGSCFECGHEHATGDRCLSFHYSPEFLEGVAAETPGARNIGFAAPRLPPLRDFARLQAEAEIARDDGDAGALGEIALRLAGGVASTLAGTAADKPRQPNRFDQRRVSEAVRRIEMAAHEPLALADLASETATSPFHFLRSFRQMTGMTPHQYVLRTRLHRAAVRLRLSDEPISAIAFDAGFNDLSTFNRRFRRIMGVTPGAFRARHRSGGAGASIL